MSGRGCLRVAYVCFCMVAWQDWQYARSLVAKVFPPDTTERQMAEKAIHDAFAEWRDLSLEDACVQLLELAKCST